VRVHRVLELLNKKFNITVIASSDKSHTKLKGMDDARVIGVGRWPLISRSMPLPFKLIPILLWNMKLAFVLLKNRFDAVYCAYDTIGFLGVHLISKIKKYKTVFEAHAVFSEDMKELGYSGIRLKLYRSLEKFVVKHSDFIIALCISTLEFYQAYNSNIDLVPVFVDSDIFKTGGRRETTESKLIGLIGPFDDDRRIYVSPFDDARRSHCLAFLYSRIDSFNIKIKFVVIGRCEKRIRHPRLTYTGYLGSLQDYVAQLSHLDAVLVPEGVATSGPLNKIIEPMSCSLPVFTTPKGIIGLYWVEPGRDILVFEENELVDKINELVFDDELMAEVGNNARKVIDQYYSKKANEEKLVRILKLVTRGQHKSHLR